MSLADPTHSFISTNRNLVLCDAPAARGRTSSRRGDRECVLLRLVAEYDRLVEELAVAEAATDAVYDELAIANPGGVTLTPAEDEALALKLGLVVIERREVDLRAARDKIGQDIADRPALTEAGRTAKLRVLRAECGTDPITIPERGKASVRERIALSLLRDLTGGDA